MSDKNHSNNEASSNINQPLKTLFPLGHIVATPGAIDLLDRTGTNAVDLLTRHVSGDWGDLDADDIRANRSAIQYGSRVFSSYRLTGRDKLWIITEADRSVTTLLLPEDY